MLIFNNNIMLCFISELCHFLCRYKIFLRKDIGIV